jgi:hypothetical protein
MPYIRVVRIDIIFLNIHRNYMFCTLFQKLWLIIAFEKGSEYVISIFALVPNMISNTLMVLLPSMDTPKLKVL